jgi:predicted Zn-dependent peptidase
MEEINLKDIDAKLYKETLDNGLTIYLLPNNKRSNYYITYGVRFGSLYTNFKDGKEEIKVPLGIAHFLEHKMFEVKEGEKKPFEFFAESGSITNAFTYYDHTWYMVMGTKKFKENLHYLLNKINNPYFTEENVNKEKGIIAEEIKRSQDRITYKLTRALKENTYYYDKHKDDIAGDIKDIKKINPVQLHICYNCYYVPNNMFVVITGNFKVEETLDIIKEECSSRKERTVPKDLTKEEPLEVVKKEDTLKDNSKVGKVGLTLKIDTSIFKNIDKVSLQIYLIIIMDNILGYSSLLANYLIKKQLASNMNFYGSRYKNIAVYYGFFYTDKEDLLIEEIKNKSLDINITKEDFARLKKTFIANAIVNSDSVEAMNDIIVDQLIDYGDVVPDIISKIRTLDYDTCKSILKKIDFSNIAIVKTSNKK